MREWAQSTAQIAVMKNQVADSPHEETPQEPSEIRAPETKPAEIETALADLDHYEERSADRAGISR